MHRVTIISNIVALTLTGYANSAPVQHISSPIKMDPQHPLKLGEKYYPMASLSAHEEGRCVVNITVASDGRITAEDIQTSTGFPRLDEACLTAVHGQRVIPVTENGVPVERTVAIPIVWKISHTEELYTQQAAALSAQAENDKKSEGCRARDEQREQNKRSAAAYAAAHAASNRCIASHDFALYQVQHRIAEDVESAAAAKIRLEHERKIAEASGTENLSVKYSAGERIVAANEDIERQWPKYKSLGGPANSPETVVSGTNPCQHLLDATANAGGVERLAYAYYCPE